MQFKLNKVLNFLNLNIYSKSIFLVILDLIINNKKRIIFTSTNLTHIIK